MQNLRLKKVIKLSIENEIKEIESLLTEKLNQLLNLYKEKRALEEFIKEKNLSDEFLEYRKTFYKNRGWK